MAYAAITNSDSPLFIDLITWIEKKNVRRLRAFFPLGRYSTWVQVRDGKAQTFFWADDLDKYREGIRADLVDPLFVRKSLNVRFESDCRRHRNDNAYCCVEFYRKHLEKIPAADLKKTLRDLQRDLKSAAPGVQFPFSWILNDQNPVASELAEVNERIAKFERGMPELVSTLSIKELDTAIAQKEMMEAENRDLLWASDLARALDERKRRYVLERCAQLLATMKWARGKPGQHPKEFNVLVYHIIKRCSKWKFDWKKRAAGLNKAAKKMSAPGPPLTVKQVAEVLGVDVRTVENYCKCGILRPMPDQPDKRFDQAIIERFREYKWRKDGQHRLETDWKLAMFLLLDLHIHRHKLPEIARFISSHKKDPASVVLRKMQAWLLNIRKNFPPMHGWTMNREGFPTPETGFRKLIVGDDGRLRIVQL